MDFSWTPYFSGYWIFPLLCLLVMGVMMLACGGMLFPCGHGARGRDEHGSPKCGPTKRERESAKEQHDAIGREQNG